VPSEKVEARHYITSACYSATEYVQAMENAPKLKAVDSSDGDKLGECICQGVASFKQHHH